MLKTFITMEETTEAALSFIKKYGAFDSVEPQDPFTFGVGFGTLKGALAVKSLLEGTIMSSISFSDIEWSLDDIERARRPKKLPSSVAAFVNKHRSAKKISRAVPIAELWFLRALLKFVLGIIGLPSAQRGQTIRGELTRYFRSAFPKVRHMERIVDPIIKSTDVALTTGAVGGRIEFRNVTEPVLVATSSTSVLYLFVWKRLVENYPPAICPRCGTVFEISRPGKLWCSEKCRKAYKARQRRAKLKGKVKKRVRR